MSLESEKEKLKLCEEENKASDLHVNENIQQATQNANLESETEVRKE